jgi:tetratricopeptide (TPR) repeat protein
MASTATPTGPFHGGAGALTPPLRQLWQVPTFLLGLLALGAVCAARPLWHESGPCGESPALAELRELIARPDFDADRALKVGAEAVQGARTPPARAEAHYLLGSVYVALAERAGPVKGGEQWRQARSHLEQAQSLVVAEEDRPHLEYRLAKAWAHTGESPQKVVAALKDLIEDGADDAHDKARGYGLLAETYLKLPKPDLEAALAATVKEIDLPNVDAVLLAPARLRRGELLLRLDRADEARDVLSHLGDKAPPETVARARRLLVGSLEKDNLWGDAAGVWRDIHNDSRVPPPDRAAVLYHRGLCLRNDGAHLDEALAAWNECLALDGAGDEGPAAALGMAELRQRGGHFDETATAFERALRDVKAPGDWRNALVSLAQARETFEAGCKAARTAGAFEASARLAELYGRLAVPGRAQELRADAIDALARATLDRARKANGGQARQLYGEAEAMLRQAGAAYEQAAGAQTEPAEQAERLWLAANDLLDGRDSSRAAAVFERFVNIAWPKGCPVDRRFLPRLNEAYYKLGLARRDTGDRSGAVEALGRAVNRIIDSPYIYRARYELAMTGHVYDPATNTYSWTDDARDKLEQNLRQLRVNSDRDAEAREKTLYSLGELYFDRYDRRGPGSQGAETRGLVSRAIDTLEEALRDFPNNKQAVFARYELAESYRLRADQLSTSLSQERLTVEARLLTEKKVMDDREKAIAHYQELSRQLEAKPPRTRDEDIYLAYALRMAAEVRYWAGGYEKSGAMFEALAERHKGHDDQAFEYCTALTGALRGYWMASTTYPSTESDYAARVRATRRKAERAMDEIRAVLPKLAPKVRASFEDYLKLFGRRAGGPVTTGSNGG